jgi:acetyl/propionyl-CoA carboxylase alpha subunit
MYFQAEQKGVKYEITVNETRHTWDVSLKPEGKDWINYNIPKETYTEMDDAVTFLFNNSSYVLDCMGSGTDYNVFTRGSFRTIKIFNDEMLLHESLKRDSAMSETNQLSAGMPGKIVKVFVTEGQSVQKGSPLLVVEAMKMENELRASRDAVIGKIFVKAGDVVEAGGPLVSFQTETKK